MNLHDYLMMAVLSLPKRMVNNLLWLRHTHKFVFFGRSSGDMFDKHSWMVIPKLINDASILKANNKNLRRFCRNYNTEGAGLFLLFYVCENLIT